MNEMTNDLTIEDIPWLVTTIEEPREWGYEMVANMLEDWLESLLGGNEK